MNIIENMQLFYIDFDVKDRYGSVRMYTIDFNAKDIHGQIMLLSLKGVKLYFQEYLSV